MQTLFDIRKLPCILTSIVLVGFGLFAIVLHEDLRRDAAAVKTASETMLKRAVEMLEFSRHVQDYPQAIGTGSEEAARDQMRTALDQISMLPDDLARQAYIGHGIGNTVLGETALRTRAEITADLLALESATDRMVAQETPVAVQAYVKRICELLLQRILPDLTLPQLVLEAEHELLSAERRKMTQILLALLAVMALWVGVAMAPHLPRAEKHRLRQTQAALDEMALTDPVSGLPNERATRNFLGSLPPQQAVLITVFEIAPAFGLPDGDETQIAIGVAGAIGKRLRELDTEALFLGQASAARFCVVLPAQEYGEVVYTQQADLEALADEPVLLDHRRVRLVFRAGVALRRPNRPALAAFENADIALDKARELRAVQPMAYRPEFRRDKVADQRLARELRVALMSGELQPHFQPQIDLRTGAVMGMEALARWHHPRLGLLAPGAFLPQAQRTGLDEPLGEVMLRMGLEALHAWDERGLNVATIGINAAGSQLSNPRFFSFVRWELDRQRIPPERLTIEVLEDIYAPSDDDPITRNLRRLSELGVRIDLDDFGTGATSVMGMRRYHATRIKIDRSYIRGIDSDTSKQTLVATMMQMARNLKIESLAEGVETGAERAWLELIGCDYLQGYSVAPPMPLEETFDWLSRYQAKLLHARGQQG